MSRRPESHELVLAAIALVALACGRGSGTGPSDFGVSASLDALEFPDTLLGDAARRVIAFQNQKDEAVNLELSIGGTNAGEFSVGDQRRVALPANGSVEVAVTYRPGSFGEHSAEMRYATRGFSATVSLRGAAVLTPGRKVPRLEVSPETIAVPPYQEATVIKAQVILRNIGQAALRFGTMEQGNWTSRMPELVTDHPESFQVDYDSQELMAGLEPGESSALRLTIKTVVGQTRSASLVIEADDPSRPVVTVPVSVAAALGRDCEPGLIPAAIEVSLSEVEEGQTLSFSFDLVDAASARDGCEVLGATWSGADSVTIVSDLPVTIAPGAATRFGLQVAPRFPGTIFGTISFDIPNAVAKPVLPVSVGIVSMNWCFEELPDWLDFQAVPVGCTAWKSMVLMNNCATSQFRVLSVEFTSIRDTSPSRDFALIHAPALPAMLSPGESLSLDIAFTPTSETESVAARMTTTTSNLDKYLYLSGSGAPRAACP